ncbi:MAG: hypothetical protein IKF56_01740 [Eggerthellaceae bacterium]|nr:hypothetical protein [Eggerthellaceae bacterium]
MPDHENTTTSASFAACADDAPAAADEETDVADADEAAALEAASLCAVDDALGCEALALRDDEHPPSNPVPTVAAPIAAIAPKNRRLVMSL